MLDVRKPINSFVKLLQHPEGPSASTLRRSAADELYELPKTETPYGKIVEQTTVLGTKGSLVWDHLNVFAFFHTMASESRQFFNLMRACADKAPGRCLSFSLYTDEVVPRNKLRPDMGGKYQAVNVQVLDFPDYIRSRLPLRWFTFGCLCLRDDRKRRKCQPLAPSCYAVMVRRDVELERNWFPLAQRWRCRARVCQVCVLAPRRAGT